VPLALVRGPSEPDERADQKAAFYCAIQGPSPAAPGAVVSHGQEAAPPARARVIDVLLYPMSFEGLARTGLFALGLWFVGLFPALFYPIGHNARVIFLMVSSYLFIVWCAALYFAHCIFDSSKGGMRAPALWSGYVYTGGDLPSMMLLGAVALCLGFTALYAAVTRDFWHVLLDSDRGDHVLAADAIAGVYAVWW
jgi:hypothetical protein